MERNELKVKNIFYWDYDTNKIEKLDYNEGSIVQYETTNMGYWLDHIIDVKSDYDCYAIVIEGGENGTSDCFIPYWTAEDFHSHWNEEKII